MLLLVPPSADRARVVDLQLGGLGPAVEVRSSLGRARGASDPFEHHRRAQSFLLSNHLIRSERENATYAGAYASKACQRNYPYVSFVATREKRARDAR